ncbi:LCP family glycopolymer transferase [Paraliobacillus ryukyuensis]|uniref:LCP family glycopolymer transferase n=1 Tax=Paraliobacillus ryukyuensis TaxID=200904 RepID=UPI0009A5AC8F|nr:LCP family protein [Paraliobacillus ryukyuensis]
MGRSEQRQERKKFKKRKKNRWIKVLLSIIGLAFVAILGYTVSVYIQAKDTVNNDIHKQVDSIDTSQTKSKLRDNDKINVLLLGIDERKDDGGRSDALMVLSMDPKDESLEIISIPRDTRTEIIGKGTLDKINHAYAFGGTDMSIATVENLLDIELDYYVHMNMQGLVDMVDAVGGVTVQNELEWVDKKGFYKKGYEFEKGPLELSGSKALGYVRMRYQDPEGDFGRTKRQRKLINAVIDKGFSIGSVGRIDDMLNVLGENMETNMDFEDMRNVLLNYRSTINNVTSYQLKGNNEYIDDIYYLQVPQEEINKVHNMLTGDNDTVQ